MGTGLFSEAFSICRVIKRSFYRQLSEANFDFFSELWNLRKKPWHALSLSASSNWIQTRLLSKRQLDYLLMQLEAFCVGERNRGQLSTGRWTFVTPWGLNSTLGRPEIYPTRTNLQSPIQMTLRISLCMRPVSLPEAGARMAMSS
ncbi:hypothetical protein SAMN05443573_102140 [Celeribacter indicus]|nr:hypothetical protein SAMN05443573_102140 [Celeribacter indicus]